MQAHTEAYAQDSHPRALPLSVAREVPNLFLRAEVQLQRLNVMPMLHSDVETTLFSLDAYILLRLCRSYW